MEILKAYVNGLNLTEADRLIFVDVMPNRLGHAIALGMRN